MSEEPEIEVDGEVNQAELEQLGSAGGPIGRVRGYPPGNPLHISPGEQGLRKEEEAKFGREVAATRAWARATEHRAKKGGATNPKPGAKAKSASNPKGSATDFKPMADGIKSAAKGNKKAQVDTWSPKVRFASQLVAMKLQRQDFAFSDDEANLITEATIDLLDFYNVKIQKVGPWGGMAYAVLMVFGPRVAALVMERVQSKPPAQAQGQ